MLNSFKNLHFLKTWKKIRKPEQKFLKVIGQSESILNFFLMIKSINFDKDSKFYYKKYANILSKIFLSL